MQELAAAAEARSREERQHLEAETRKLTVREAEVPSSARNAKSMTLKYEPASEPLHFCEVVVLRLRTVPISTAATHISARCPYKVKETEGATEAQGAMRNQKCEW